MKKLKSEETTITSNTPSSDEEVEAIGRRRESRIGRDFQVDCNCIPNPTSKPSILPEEYLDLSRNVDGSKAKNENDYSIYELVWDPNAAKRKGVEEFIEMYVPSSHKEFALEALHKRNYNIDGLMEDLEEKTPLDGSDWSFREKTLFRELMIETKHDLQEVAEKIGKSFGNCLVVFYKTMGNVQSERSKRSRRKNNDYSSLSDGIGFDLQSPSLLKKSKHYRSRKSSRKSEIIASDQEDGSQTLFEISNDFVECSRKNDDTSAKAPELSLKFDHENETRTRDKKKSQATGTSTMSLSTKPPSTIYDGDSSKCSDTYISNEKYTEINGQNDSELTLEKTQDVNDDVLVTPSTRPSINTIAFKHKMNQEFLLTVNTVQNTIDSCIKGSSGTLKTAEIEAPLSSNQSSTESSEYCSSTDKQSPHVRSIMDTNISENLENQPSSKQNNLLEKNGNENTKSDMKTLEFPTAENSENNNDNNAQSPLANLTQNGIETKSCDVVDTNIKTDMDAHSVGVLDDVDDQSDKEENESVSRRRSPRHLHTSKDALFDQRNSTYKNTFSTLSNAPGTTRQQRYPRRSAVEYNLKEDDANISFKKTRSRVKAGAKEELNEKSLSMQKRYPSRSKRKSTDTDQGPFGKRKKQNVKHERSTSSRSRRVSPRNLSVTFGSKSKGNQLRQFRRNQRQSKLEANDRIHELSSSSGEHPDENRETKERKRISVVKAENKDNVQKETKALQKVTTRREDLARPKTNNTPEFEETFDVRLAELKEFYEKNGHGLVPKVYENKKLSYWVFRLRSLESNTKSRHGTRNCLTPWHKKLLKKYGFMFQAREKAFQFQRERKKEEREIAFDQKFERLVKFKKKHGHCIVPKHYPPDQPLSYWVFRSRQYKVAQETRGAQEMISQEQIKRLDRIGFVWAAKKNPTWLKAERARIQAIWDESWENTYKKLLRFKKKHGHTNIPKKWPQDQHLASWCFRQKRLYRMDQDLEDGEVSNMAKHKKEKLEKIGFNFHSNKRSPQKDTDIDSGDESCDSFDSGKNIGFSRKLRSNRNGYKKEVGERKGKINGRMTRTSLSAASASSNKGASDDKESSQMRTNKRKKKNSVNRRKEGLGRKRKSMIPSATSSGSKNEIHNDEEEKVDETIANLQKRVRMTRNSLSTLAHSPIASAYEHSNSNDQESEDEDITENPEKRVRMTRNSLSTLAHSPIASTDEHSDSNDQESEDEDITENPEKRVRMTRNSLSTLAHSPIASTDEHSDSNHEESEDEDITENPEKRVRMTRNSLSTLAHSPIASTDEHSDSNHEESEDEDITENPEKRVRMTRNSLSTLAYSFFQASKSFLEK